MEHLESEDCQELMASLDQTDDQDHEDNPVNEVLQVYLDLMVQLVNWVNRVHQDQVVTVENRESLDLVVQMDSPAHGAYLERLVPQETMVKMANLVLLVNREKEDLEDHQVKIIIRIIVSVSISKKEIRRRKRIYVVCQLFEKKNSRDILQLAIFPLG